MPLKLSVSFSKKLGQPNYGSIGASCQLECELDNSLLEHDLEQFQRRVHDAYVACDQAVHEELSRHQARSDSADDPIRSSNRSHSRGDRNGNGDAPHEENGSPSANGRPETPIRFATHAQLRAIRAIADRQGINLDELLRARFEVERPEDLSLRDASGLIDELQTQAPGDRR